MPKLIITLTEKLVPVPDDPDRLLIGIETDIHLEFSEEEAERKSVLPSLVPFLESAINVAQQAAFGQSILSQEGGIEDSQEAALAAVEATRFPKALP